MANETEKENKNFAMPAFTPDDFGETYDGPFKPSGGNLFLDLAPFNGNDVGRVVELVGGETRDKKENKFVIRLLMTNAKRKDGTPCKVSIDLVLDGTREVKINGQKVKRKRIMDFVDWLLAAGADGCGSKAEAAETLAGVELTPELAFGLLQDKEVPCHLKEDLFNGYWRSKPEPRDPATFDPDYRTELSPECAEWARSKGIAPWSASGGAAPASGANGHTGGNGKTESKPVETKTESKPVESKPAETPPAAKGSALLDKIRNKQKSA